MAGPLPAASAFTAAGSLAGFEATSMLARPEVAPERSALVVIDMVNHQLTPGQGLLGDLRRGGVDTTYIERRVTTVVLPNIVRLIGACRSEGVAVAFVRAGGLAGGLRDSLPASRRELRAWSAGADDWGSQVLQSIAPEPGDLSLVKLGSGAFTTSHLDQHLRFMGVDTVFYVGVLTSACVLLSAGAGFDLGYHGYVVADCTATISEELQQASQAIIASFMATVVTTDHTIALLRAVQ
jgi:nicotinamidase-related amidase